MKVRCITAVPSEAQQQLLGRMYSPGRTSFEGEPGKEYLVFGLSFTTERGVWLYILGDRGFLFMSPLCLFEISDGRPSRHWVVAGSDHNCALVPQQFLDIPDYGVRLADGDDPAIQADFARLRSLLEAEANTQ